MTVSYYSRPGSTVHICQVSFALLYNFALDLLIKMKHAVVSRHTSSVNSGLEADNLVSTLTSNNTCNLAQLKFNESNQSLC